MLWSPGLAWWMGLSKTTLFHAITKTRRERCGGSAFNHQWILDQVLAKRLSHMDLTAWRMNRKPYNAGVEDFACIRRALARLNRPKSTCIGRAVMALLCVDRSAIMRKLQMESMVLMYLHRKLVMATSEAFGSNFTFFTRHWRSLRRRSQQGWEWASTYQRNFTENRSCHRKQ